MEWGILNIILFMGDAMRYDIRKLGMCCLGCMVIISSAISTGAATINEDDLPELRIGCDEYEPYNYLDENGDLVGIDASLADEVCRRMGYRLMYVLMEWKEKDSYLDSGVIDCIWNAYSTNGREDQYLWTDPYMYSRESVVVNEDSPIYTLDDLSDRTVATLVNTRAESILLQQKVFPQLCPESVYSFQDMGEALAALELGYVDAAAGDRLYIENYMENHPGKLRVIEESLETSRFAVAFSKDEDPELVDRLNKTLKEMKQDGTTDEILARYGVKQASYAEEITGE